MRSHFTDGGLCLALLLALGAVGCEMPELFPERSDGSPRAEAPGGAGGQDFSGGIYDRKVHGRKLTQEEENRLIGANMHNQLGMEAFGKGDYALAVERFHLAIRQVPDYIDAINNLGRAYYEQGKFGAALSAYRHALDLVETIEPNNAGIRAAIHANIGDIHRQREEYAQAVSEYLQVQRLAPQSPRAYYELGNLYVKQGKLSDAIAKFSKTLKLDARFDKARLGRAIAYNLAGEYRAAWEDIARLEELGYEVTPDLKQAVLDGIRAERERARFRPGT